MAGTATCATLIALLSLPSATEPGRFPAERWRPAGDRTGILDVESGLLLAPWQLDASLWVGYAHEPLAIYRRAGDGSLERAGAIVGPRVGANAVVALGILDWLQLDLDVPVVLYQARGALPEELPLAPLSAAGLGDLRVSPKLRLLRAADVGVDVAFLPTFTAPTALPRADYFGEKFFTAAPELALSRDIFGVRFAGDVGYRARTISSSAGVVFGHEVFYRAGLSIAAESVGLAQVPVAFDVGVGGAVTVLPEPGASAPLEGLAGIRWDIAPGLSLSAAAGAGLLGAPGVPDFRALAGVRWGMDFSDGDGDGIANADDRCVEVAEDRDGLADGDGCPEDDADADGIADHNDRCPEQGEDKDGFEDVDGCLDDDDDTDGLADAIDMCPQEPGGASWAGCAPPDGDGDRIADHLDLCPTRAAKRRDGCPLEEQAVSGAVEPPPELVELGDPFTFATASAALTPAAAPGLNKLAQLLKDKPELRVRIEGHTDDTGYNTFNMQLSRWRAEAVKRSLVARGIDPSRLETEGYGAGRPIAAGQSAEARAKNRRVELIALENRE